MNASQLLALIWRLLEDKDLNSEAKMDYISRLFLVVLDDIEK